MAKIITIKCGVDVYKLEYTRATAAETQRNGFDPDKLDNEYITMIPLLIHGAFKAHHKNISEDEAMNVYESIKSGKTELIKKLCEMYSDSIMTLVVDNNEGNATWEAGW